MNHVTTIYALIDPDTKEVKYIGRTRQTMKDRLAQHLYNNNDWNKLKGAWIEGLRKENKRPIIQSLEVTRRRMTSEIELKWIKFYENNGATLLNLYCGKTFYR